jgi:hypothetical protein
VDGTGKIIREAKVASEPDALLRGVLRNAAYRFKRIGLEAGPLSQWLFSALAEVNFPVVCVETRHWDALNLFISRNGGWLILLRNVCASKLRKTRHCPTNYLISATSRSRESIAA